MASATYCVAPGTDPTTVQARADQLGCGVSVGDPSGGLVTVWPSIVVMSPVVSTVVIPDDTGEATIDAVSAAMDAAVTAEAAAAHTVATANANIQAFVAQFGPALAQGSSDLAELAASTDPLAPIITRILQGELTMAQVMADTLVVLNIVPASAL